MEWMMLLLLFPSNAIAKGTANSEYTLEAWINVHTSSGTTTSADCIMGHNTQRGVGMQVGVANGNPRVNYGARYAISLVQFNYNEWRHIVLTRDGTDGPIAYENGVGWLEIMIILLYMFQMVYSWRLQYRYAGPRITGYFDGFIGELGFMALTPAQVFQNYNSTKTKIQMNYQKLHLKLVLVLYMVNCFEL